MYADNGFASERAIKSRLSIRRKYLTGELCAALIDFKNASDELREYFKWKYNNLNEDLQKNLIATVNFNKKTIDNGCDSVIS